MTETRRKQLHLGKCIEDLDKLHNVPDLKTKRANLLCKTAQKLFESAEEARKNGDEEYSYVYYMKYLRVIAYLSKDKEYLKDKSYYNSMLGAKNPNKAIDAAEKLKNSLIDRYAMELKQKRLNDIKENEIFKQKIEENRKKAIEVSINEPPSTPVNLPGPDEVTIKSEQLYSILKAGKLKVMILDARPGKDYLESHISYPACISVPEECISPGNNIDLPSSGMLSVVETLAKKGKAEIKTQRKATYMDLVRLPSLRIKNLCCCVVWLVIGISFYGGTQYFGQTSINTFLSVAVGGLVQIPGLPVSAYFSKRFGRRVAIIGMFVINCICNLLLVLPDAWFYLKLVAGSIANACGAAAFSVVYVYTTELFPTVARNMAMGASSTTTRAGSMLAPFFGELNVLASWLPPIVFGLFPVLGIVACYFLPETKGKQLDDHLDES